MQVLKAGILEIADIFVVNKADHPMANQLRREIRTMMEMLDFSGWVPELVSTQAISGEGLEDLWAAIARHIVWLNESGAIEEKRRDAFAHQVRQLALGRLQRRLERELRSDIAAGVDPYAAADRVLSTFNVYDDNEEDGFVARPRATVKGLTTSP